ncbi:alkylation response protein AidB-like acyl-CoA dehydrogenase [Thermocatellispora tengchongensis]|uniref:Alkylation response protein AidB-like acyl-CoA dehydrogenase n=1 Tax=Thermocatellispora tengchongensis TaxID=1073253 RepID=A0A840NYR0_9ACTN|nr:acyl-CoA dehydrogenase family protein [Thermocatellispora tengchongensis]MBB5132302.1 alkylation response protein AidB-like acyl-CoA dehydrogenase [Thermocatellispora tengchongensis]
MKIGWTLAQRAIADHYEALAREHVAARSEWHYAREQLDQGAWRALADDGLWRIPVPEELGGHGMTWWEFCAALEGIARGGRDLGFCLSLIAHAGFLRSLVIFGGEYHHTVALPKMMGGAIGATALTEMSGGSDVARVATTAHPTAQGYKLVGTKTHITNAPVADMFWVLGRIDKLPAKRDISVFVLERQSSGMQIGAPEHMFGNRSSPTGPVSFFGLPITAGQVLGRPGDGLSLTYATIALDRLLYGVVGAAYLEGLLQEAIGFAEQRTAFGRPIADYQYVQRRITNVKLAIESARWVSYAALASLLEEREEAALMSSTAKLIGSEGLAGAALDVMQIFGHTGYQLGHHSRNVQDALGTLIAGGTSDIQRKNIFTQLLRLRKSQRAATPAVSGSAA